MSQYLKEFTLEEVAKHNKAGDLWVIIDSKVFDLSKFSNMHPGGLSVLLDEDIAGQDATDAFFSLHRLEVLQKPQYQRLQVGTIRNQTPQIRSLEAGAVSKVPYAEPTWLSDGFHSPYFKESHRCLQRELRKFVVEVIYLDAQEREEDGKMPSREVIRTMAHLGLTAMRVGPGKHLKGLTLMNGVVTPEEFDFFHEMLIHQEIGRLGARGYSDGLLAGVVIGLPPVLNFGQEPLRSKIIQEVFSGEKIICLAISEAFAGSDVAGLKTTAVKTDDGKHWVINGTKKWITNAMFSDYFVVGCRTKGGYTAILVPRQEGVETRPIKTSYSSAAGTAFVTLDNVKVPVENTLGPEDGGLSVILSNFNHERWAMACSSVSNQRTILEECLKWATQRQVFGKPLISQPVIRAKLAAMIARVESSQNWLENVTHQMCNMDYKDQSKYLAGQIAFLKMHCTKTAQATAEDATQVFGGRGLTRTGMGRFIEHYHRTVVFDSLLGGAEDVLGDLGVRQALRQMPKNARL